MVDDCQRLADISERLKWEQWLPFYPVPRGVLRISSEEGDRRIILGFEFSISGFFWIEKFGKYFFVT